MLLVQWNLPSAWLTAVVQHFFWALMWPCWEDWIVCSSSTNAPAVKWVSSLGVGRNNGGDRASASYDVFSCFVCAFQPNGWFLGIHCDGGTYLVDNRQTGSLKEKPLVSFALGNLWGRESKSWLERKDKERERQRENRASKAPFALSHVIRVSLLMCAGGVVGLTLVAM